MNSKILHICINYNQERETELFTRSLQKLNHFENVDLCIVDNSALPNQNSVFSNMSFGDQQQQVSVINPKANLGYFGAAQKAYLELGQKNKYDWIIISNTDLQIVGYDFYDKLLNYPLTEEIGAIAPEIISEISQKDSNPFLVTRPSRLKMKFLDLVFSNYLTCQAYQILAYYKEFFKRLASQKKPLTDKSNIDSKLHDNLHLNLNVNVNSNTTKMIYAAHGAFMIFSKNYFAKGLDFTHPAFLYCEEITVAEKMRQTQLKTIYDPSFKIIHKEHGSTGLISYFFSNKTFQFKKESSKKVYDAYFK